MSWGNWTRSSERAACAEAREAALFGPGDATGAARVQRHIAHCAACQAQQRRLEATRTGLVAEDVPLDDLTRARMLDRLSGRLDDLAARGGRSRGPVAARGRWLAGFALVAAAGTALLVYLPSPSPSQPVQAWRATPPSSTPVVVEARPVPPPNQGVQARALIYSQASVSGRDRLAVPAGARTRARLGDHTRLWLIGPAELEVLTARTDLLEVRLSRGTLLAEHDHASKRRLRIQSPHTATEIVGTTFLIEAGAGRSRVAVAQGQVVVRNDEQGDHIVAAGQMWSTDAGAQAPAPASRAIKRLFRQSALPAGFAQLREPSRPRPLAYTAPVPARRASAAPAPALAPSPSAAAVAAVPSASPALAPPPAPPPPAPPPPPVLPPPALAPPPDPTALYRLAEQAMSRGDDGEAGRRLEQLAALPEAGALTDLARYELAQRALRAGDLPAARRWLHTLSAGSRLAEPAQLFACDLDLRAGATMAARRCYERFRAEHPGSVQDAEALGALLTLLPPSEACSVGRPLLLEYLARYPEGARAGEARRRRAECP